MLPDGLVDTGSTATPNVLLAANELEFAANHQSGGVDNITVDDCLNAAKLLRMVVIERDTLQAKLTGMETGLEL